ncbi:Transthyretin-like family protein [Ancylostoma ceylanicum]|uniref:Transthyretin-like family protein n=2 Tax=Ancylostoma ceylanicum TaxID=53326 RepID=A0A0D6LWT1_9BILA|nr:Transthyretin-like family protein [Ancylostoma ceylanicum]EYC32524.1 hypothetical protein Y032_0003g1629 [Ancylostoma ceylanicum]
MRAAVLVLLSYAHLSSCDLTDILLQAVGVKGKLTCHGKPVGGVDVYLMEADIREETLMSRGKTNKTGHFKLEGTDKEVTTMEPVLKILHKCDYAPGCCCYHKKRFPIPQSYVVRRSRKPRRFYDLGVIELSKKMQYDLNDQCIAYDDIKDIL